MAHIYIIKSPKEIKLMKRSFFLAVIFIANLQLNAINPINFTAETKIVNTKTLSLQLVNLQENVTNISITNLKEDVEFFTQSIKTRNGFTTNLNLKNLENGKYLLIVKNNGTTQKQVIRITDNLVLLSEFAS